MAAWEVNGKVALVTGAGSGWHLYSIFEVTNTNRVQASTMR